MVSLSLNTLIIAVLVAFVVLSVKPVKDIAFAATENTAKVFGLDIGKPRIGSFTAVPLDSDGDKKFEMMFELLIAGNKKDVVLEIYESKASDVVASELKAPDPEFDADSIIYTTEGSGEMDDIKGGILSKKCPGDGGCRKILIIKNPRTEFKPGWYKFSAVLKKRGKTVYQSETLMGFYTEDYVELLDKPIAGCNDPAYGNCNVVECKKTLINTDLYHFTAPNNIKFDLRAPVAQKISDEFRATPRTGYYCGRMEKPPGQPTGILVTEGCTNDEIDELNKMVVRARLLEYANMVQPDVMSEDDYGKYINELGSWKGKAVEMTMSCTQPSGWRHAPKGAYSELEKLGWLRVPERGGFNYWETEVRAMLDVVLKSKVPPGIEWFKVTPKPDMTFEASWKPTEVGINNIKSFQVRRAYSKFAKGIDLVKGVNNPESSLIFAEIQDPAARSKALPKGDFGMHKYILSVIYVKDKENKVSDSKEYATGLFNDFFPDSYLELYMGNFQKGYLKADFLKDIVPDAKKKSVVGKLNKKLREKYPATTCELKESGDLENEKGCSPEDLRELYRLAVFEAVTFKGKEYALNVFTCKIPEWRTLNPPTRPKYYVSPSLICEAKDSLRQTLTGSAWLEVTQADKDDAIQAAVDKFADEEANPVVTGLKAFASISQPGKIELTWSMPLGKGNVFNDAILLQHWRTYYPENLDWAEKEQPPVTSVPAEPAKYYFEPADLIGQHKFRFTTWSKDGSSADVKTIITGVYDRNYLETYDRDVDDKVCEDAEKATRAAGEIGCNVIKEKTRVFLDDVPKNMEVFGEEKKYPRLAYHRFHDEDLDKECSYDWEKKKLFRKAEVPGTSPSTPAVIQKEGPCSAEDVNTLYNYLIDEIYPEPSYHTQNSAAKSCNTGGLDYNVWRACSSKESLLKSLYERGWSCFGDGCPRPGLPLFWP